MHRCCTTFTAEFGISPNFTASIFWFSHTDGGSTLPTVRIWVKRQRISRSNLLGPRSPPPRPGDTKRETTTTTSFLDTYRSELYWARARAAAPAGWCSGCDFSLAAAACFASSLTERETGGGGQRVLSVTVLTLLGKYHGAAGGAQTFCACWLPPEGVPRGGATGYLFGPFNGERRSLFFVFSLLGLGSSLLCRYTGGGAARFRGAEAREPPPLSGLCTSIVWVSLITHEGGGLRPPVPPFGFWHFRKHLECCSAGSAA